MSTCKYCNDVTKLAEDALKPVEGLHDLTDVGKLADDAIKTGDLVKIDETKTEIEKKLESCIKKGVCSESSGIAAGIITAAAIGGGTALVIATDAEGKQYIFSSEDKTYREITPTTREPEKNDYVTRQTVHTYEENGIKKSDYADELIAPDMLPAFNALMKSRLPYILYTEGETGGIQGTLLDKNEMICQNFAIQAVEALNKDPDMIKSGLVAKVVSLLGKYTESGEVIAHSLVAIENKNKPIGSYIDENGNEQTLYELTLLEPQTGEMSYPAADLTKTTMRLGGDEYTIESIEILDTAEQRHVIQYDLDDKEHALPVLQRGEMLIQTDDKSKILQENQYPLTSEGHNETIKTIAQIDPWWSQGLDVKIENK
jgi:hypothetical protein